MSVNGIKKETSGESLIRQAVRRLHQIAENDVPPQLQEKVTLALLDYLGAVSCGLQAPWAGQLKKYASSRKKCQEAHVWGLQEDRSAETAAFVNAALAHRSVNRKFRFAKEAKRL